MCRGFKSLLRYQPNPTQACVREDVRAGELGEPAGDLYLEGEALSRMHRHPLHGAERRHKIGVAVFRLVG